MGGMATMEKDVLPKVGPAIVDAIKKQQTTISDGYSPTVTAPAVAPASAGNPNLPAEMTARNSPQTKETPDNNVTAKTDDTGEQLRTLKKLRDDGLLTQDEYDLKKQNMLEEY